MSDLRCSQCHRDYEAAPCGLLHAITVLQIRALRQIGEAILRRARGGQ